MDLSTCASELYGLPAAEFVAARTAMARRAREAGDRGLATALVRLAKPSVAAALLNAVVRENPSLVAELTELGGELRAAQAHLDAAGLAALRPRRDDLLHRVVEVAAARAQEHGRRASAATLDEVRGTLVAALADEAAQHALASGRLTRALSYAGFGEVDLDEAVAVPGPPAAAAPASDNAAEPGGENESADADENAEAPGPLRRRGMRATTHRDAATHERLSRQAERAQAALTEADHALTRANIAAAEADREAEKHRRRVDELTALLDRARAEADEARAHAEQARADVERAERDVAAARRALDTLG